MISKYKQAGVDIESGYKSVELIKKHIKKTQNKNSINIIGDFGGIFPLDLCEIKEPVLVSGTDGVGTKLKFAFMLDYHESIGIDCVAMCVNDILCVGAKPLFFLDYIALDKNIPEKVEKIVKGMADGCIQAQCQLLGGETAEMPNFYAKNEYDVAGFCVGIVDKNKILNKNNVKEKDVLIGISSSGLHSNGFSLVRKILQDKKIDSCAYQFNKKPLIETLLTPTKIYVKTILNILKQYNIKSISHITGGGFYENIPRSIPDNLCAKIELNSFEKPDIFNFLQKEGNISTNEMYKIFNMGIGMVLCVSKNDCNNILDTLKKENEQAFIIGEIGLGNGIKLC